MRHYGLPGKGKSKALKKWAKKNGIPYKKIKIEKVDREDFYGLPTAFPQWWSLYKGLPTWEEILHPQKPLWHWEM